MENETFALVVTQIPYTRSDADQRNPFSNKEASCKYTFSNSSLEFQCCDKNSELSHVWI